MTIHDSLSAFLRLLRFAPRRKIATVLVLMICAALTAGVGVLLLVPLIALTATQLGGPSAPFPHTWMPFLAHLNIAALLGLFMLLVIMRAILLYWLQIRTVQLVSQTVDGLRHQCFEAMLHAQWRWLSQQQASMFNNHMVTSVSRIGQSLQQATSLMAGSVGVLVLMASALFLSWQLALVAIVGGVLFLMLGSNHRKHVVRLGQSLSSAHQSMHRQIQEGVAGVRLTRIWQGETQALQDFSEITTELRQISLDFQKSSGRGRIALQVGGAAFLAGLVLYAIEILAVSQAVLLPLLLVLGRLISALGALQVNWHNWLHSVPAMVAIEDLLADARGAAEPPHHEEIDQIELEAQISLVDVTVKYATRQHASLDNLSATIPAFTTTVITGPSGAGKSTLADVLTGLISPDAGQMIIDGVAINDATRTWWRRSIAYVQQDSFLFNASIRENLTKAAPDASEAQMIDALQLASAGFALELPQGLDTIVGDNGVRLSGGERQRIALARALLRKPSLLVLDEATSAVDQANELAIQHAIARLKGKMTIIAITHRGFRDMAADQVITLHKPADPNQQEHP